MSFTQDDERRLQALLEKKREHERKLREERRTFERLCEQTFGITSAEVSMRLSEGSCDALAELGKTVCAYYGLSTTSDIRRWKEVMLNANSKNFFEGKK